MLGITVALTAASIAVGSLVVSVLLSAPWLGHVARAARAALGMYREAWLAALALATFFVLVYGLAGAIRFTDSAEERVRRAEEVVGELYWIQYDLDRLDRRMDSTRAYMERAQRERALREGR